MYGQLSPCSHCGQACGSERQCGERLREEYTCQRCGDGLREHEEGGEWIGWVCPTCDLPPEQVADVGEYDFSAPQDSGGDVSF